MGLVNMERYEGWSSRERARGVGFERSEGCSLIVREVDIVQRVFQDRAILSISASV